MQIENWNLILCQSELAKLFKQLTVHAVEDVGNGGYPCTDGRSTKLNSHYANQFGWLSESSEYIYHKTQLYHFLANTQLTLHFTSETLGQPYSLWSVHNSQKLETTSKFINI